MGYRSMTAGIQVACRMPRSNPVSSLGSNLVHGHVKKRICYAIPRPSSATSASCPYLQCFGVSTMLTSWLFFYAVIWWQVKFPLSNKFLNLFSQRRLQRPFIPGKAHLPPLFSFVFSAVAVDILYSLLRIFFSASSTRRFLSFSLTISRICWPFVCRISVTLSALSSHTGGARNL